jgi:hypothetical protein
MGRMKVRDFIEMIEIQMINRCNEMTRYKHRNDGFED